MFCNMVRASVLLIVLFTSVYVSGQEQARTREREAVALLQSYRLENTATAVGSGLLTCYNKELSDEIIREVRLNQHCRRLLSDDGRFEQIQALAKSANELALTALRIYSNSVFRLYYVGSHEEGPFSFDVVLLAVDDSLVLHSVAVDETIEEMDRALASLERLPAVLTLRR